MDKFVPLAWHPFGDTFYTAEAGARGAFYSILETPTAVFDGTDQIIGGSSTTYDEYMSKYNARRAVSAPLTITYLAKSYSGNHASVKVKVKLEENIQSGNKVYIVLWEDKCVYDSREFRFVERLQPAPVVLTITQAGKEQTIKKEFTLNASWTKNNLGISTFVQKDSNKSILNGKGVRLVLGVDVAPATLGRVKALYY